MLCWFCHWGWPKPIADIFNNAVKKLGGDDSPLKFGPSHIVWADENFDSAQWCLEHFDEFDHGIFSESELSIVRDSLTQLLSVPDEFKYEPCDFSGVDGEPKPEDYPPPPHWTMVIVS